MKSLRLISRVAIGLVFIFSGTVKAVDPLGSAYKFHDYFMAFHLEFLQPLALALAILLCTAEFIAGVSVLTGYRQKYGNWLVFILMIVFTPLTFVLAVANPVSDCGCFGDAIHLTNWQTFAKNIVLLSLSVILLTDRKDHKELLKPVKEWMMISLVAVLFVVFSILNLLYLPIFDFLPYKAGVNISEGMKVPEGMPVDKYETTFIYEKNGVKKEFSLENYPADDSAWKFVDQKSVLVKKGYQPPIHDFSIAMPDGEDLTDKILANNGYTVLMISTKLGRAGEKKLRHGFELGSECLLKNIGFYVLTASGSDKVSSFKNGLTICTTDETTLKTIVRSNPGYVLIRGGTILGKWSWAALPSTHVLTDQIKAGNLHNLNNRRWPLYAGFGILTATVLLLLISSLYRRETDGSEN